MYTDISSSLFQNIISFGTFIAPYTRVNLYFTNELDQECEEKWLWLSLYCEVGSFSYTYATVRNGYTIPSSRTCRKHKVYRKTMLCQVSGSFWKIIQSALRNGKLNQIIKLNVGTLLKDHHIIRQLLDINKLTKGQRINYQQADIYLARVLAKGPVDLVFKKRQI